MLLGALVDAGADRQAVFAALAGLGVDGYALTFERVQRCGVAATWANVVVEHPDHGHEHRPAGQIRKLLDACRPARPSAQPRPGGVRRPRRGRGRGPRHRSRRRRVPRGRRRRRRRRCRRHRRRARRRWRSTRSSPDPWPSGEGRSPQPTAPCRTRRPPSPAARRGGGCPPSASTPTWSWRRRPASPSSPRSPARSARCRR